MGPTFTYNPDPSPLPPPPPTPPPPDDLGLLEGLQGRWAGKGFNAIWRPNQLTRGQDRFLELNITSETLEFDVLAGGIPNRGLLQQDITMGGLRYLQQIADVNVPAPNNGLHVEPGVWLNVPATTDPFVSASVVRMGSVPHGTTILAQGLASQVSGAPVIADINLNPFSIGNPGSASLFPEQNLATSTPFRTQDLTGITQGMVDNPNSVLKDANDGLTFTSMVVLQVSSLDLPVPGGGTTNTAFLLGGADGPNANAASVTATFWLETVEGAPAQLQYTQTVLLNFSGLSWPHVTVATLRPATD